MSGACPRSRSTMPAEGDPVEATLIGVWSLPKEPTTAAFSAGDWFFGMPRQASVTRPRRAFSPSVLQSRMRARPMRPFW